MEEDMSAKKKIIKITFGAAAIMMLLSGRNTAKVSAQTVSEDGERYRIEQNEEDGKRYLTDRHGQTVAGWHVRIGNKYYRIGKVNDIGLCRSKRFKIIFTKKNGQLVQNGMARGFSFDARGLLAVKRGIYRISGKYYYIDHGYMYSRDYSKKGTQYFMNLDGSVAYYRNKHTCYAPSGKKLTKQQRKEAVAREHARVIIRECVQKQHRKKAMSQSKKLDKCFMWVVKNYDYSERKCDGKKGWTSKSADALYRFQTGDCRTLSVGFAFLASELGYKRVVIAQDTSDRFSGTHVWAVVNGKCYDPLFYNTAKPKRYLPVFKGSTQKQYTDKTHCIVNGKFRPGD